MPAKNSSFLAENECEALGEQRSDTCVPFLQSWDIFFRNTNAGAPPGTAYQSPLPLSPGALFSTARAQPLVEAQPNVDKLVEDHLAVQSLIRAYQVRRGYWGAGPAEGVPGTPGAARVWACKTGCAERKAARTTSPPEQTLWP